MSTVAQQIGSDQAKFSLKDRTRRKVFASRSERDRRSRRLQVAYDSQAHRSAPRTQAAAHRPTHKLPQFEPGRAEAENNLEEKALSNPGNPNTHSSTEAADSQVVAKTGSPVRSQNGGPERRSDQQPDSTLQRSEQKKNFTIRQLFCCDNICRSIFVYIIIFLFLLVLGFSVFKIATALRQPFAHHGNGSYELPTRHPHNLTDKSRALEHVPTVRGIATYRSDTKKTVQQEDHIKQPTKISTTASTPKTAPNGLLVTKSTTHQKVTPLISQPLNEQHRMWTHENADKRQEIPAQNLHFNEDNTTMNEGEKLLQSFLTYSSQFQNSNGLITTMPTPVNWYGGNFGYPLNYFDSDSFLHQQMLLRDYLHGYNGYMNFQQNLPPTLPVNTVPRNFMPTLPVHDLDQSPIHDDFLQPISEDFVSVETPSRKEYPVTQPISQSNMSARRMLEKSVTRNRLKNDVRKIAQERKSYHGKRKHRRKNAFRPKSTARITTTTRLTSKTKSSTTVATTTTTATTTTATTAITTTKIMETTRAIETTPPTPKTTTSPKLANTAPLQTTGSTRPKQAAPLEAPTRSPIFFTTYPPIRTRTSPSAPSKWSYSTPLQYFDYQNRAAGPQSDQDSETVRIPFVTARDGAIPNELEHTGQNEMVNENPTDEFFAEGDFEDQDLSEGLPTFEEDSHAEILSKPFLPQTEKAPLIEGITGNQKLFNYNRMRKRSGHRVTNNFRSQREKKKLPIHRSKFLSAADLSKNARRKLKSSMAGKTAVYNDARHLEVSDFGSGSGMSEIEASGDISSASGSDAVKRNSHKPKLIDVIRDLKRRRVGERSEKKNGSVYTMHHAIKKKDKRRRMYSALQTHLKHVHDKKQMKVHGKSILEYIRPIETTVKTFHVRSCVVIEKYPMNSVAYIAKLVPGKNGQKTYEVRLCKTFKKKKNRFRCQNLHYTLSTGYAVVKRRKLGSRLLFSLYGCRKKVRESPSNQASSKRNLESLAGRTFNSINVIANIDDDNDDDVHTNNILKRRKAHLHSYGRASSHSSLHNDKGHPTQTSQNVLRKHAEHQHKNDEKATKLDALMKLVVDLKHQIREATSTRESSRDLTSMLKSRGPRSGKKATMKNSTSLSRKRLWRHTLNSENMLFKDNNVDKQVYEDTSGSGNNEASGSGSGELINIVRSSNHKPKRKTARTRKSGKHKQTHKKRRRNDTKLKKKKKFVHRDRDHHGVHKADRLLEVGDLGDENKLDPTPFDIERVVRNLLPVVIKSVSSNEEQRRKATAKPRHNNHPTPQAQRDLIPTPNPATYRKNRWKADFSVTVPTQHLQPTTESSSHRPTPSKKGSKVTHPTKKALQKFVTLPQAKIHTTHTHSSPTPKPAQLTKHHPTNHPRSRPVTITHPAIHPTNDPTNHRTIHRTTILSNYPTVHQTKNPGKHPTFHRTNHPTTKTLPHHASNRPSHKAQTAERPNINEIISELKRMGISPAAHPTKQSLQGQPSPTKPVSSLQKAPTPNQKPAMPHPVPLHQPDQVRILCFGDSLTAGYNKHGKNFYPYCGRMQDILNYRSKTPVYTDTKGVVGEMTHKQMTSRLPLVLGNATKPYDWIIILGGTNDMLHVKNFADDQEFLNQLENVWQPRISKDIEKLHQISYSHGAHTVLLTIPENAIEGWPDYKPLLKMRQRINDALRKFAVQSEGKTVLCDLAMKMPRHTLGPQQEALLWDDNLHMTPEGYSKMAGIVADCLQPYLPHSKTW